jgi:hypothetical protein
MITLTLASGDQAFTLSPSSLSVTRAVCNDNLQHVEQQASCSVVYEPDVFAFLALATDIQAVIKDGTNALFTGVCNADLSWRDDGDPAPVDKIALTVKDNTYKLDRKTTAEIALINTTLLACLQRLCADCGVSLATGLQIKAVALEAFVIDGGKSYLQTLDALLFQYGYSFYFSAAGELALFDFADIPAQPAAVAGDTLLTGVSVSRQNKKYTAVRVNYNTIIKKDNELVYFSGGGYGSDNKPADIVLQPGVYYPFDSNPITEAAEGKVYQTFEGGYAETVRKYNGETDYRRSQKTTLLYTESHTVTEDWETGIVIDRAEFGSRRAAVRLRNASGSDKTLKQLSVRADAYYRNADVSVVSGTGAGEYAYTGEFIYSPAPAHALASLLYRYFTGKKYKITAKSEAEITPGSFRLIDAGISGFAVPALAVSVVFDPEAALYSSTWITAGDAAVDTTRYKSAAGDDAAQWAADGANRRIDELISGAAHEDAGEPANVPSANARAHQDYIEFGITWTAEGLANTVKRFHVSLARDGDFDRASIYYTTELTYRYRFDRALDGHPEKTDFAAWRWRVRAENIYGRLSPAWTPGATGGVIDTSGYGTWIPNAAAIGNAKARANNIEAFVSYAPPPVFYGAVEFVLRLTYSGATRHTLRQPELQYLYRFDRAVDGFPEKAGYSLTGIFDANRQAVTSCPQLALYKLSVQAINITSDKTSAVSTAVSLDTSEYLTWLPSTPVLSGRTAGRTAEITIDYQNFYGAAGAVFQIGKVSPTADAGRYAPLMADIETVYISESAWKGAANADRYEPSGQLTQQLPLEGQAVDAPVDTTYTYRARGVTKDLMGAILYYSGLSPEQTVLAKATGIRDVVNNAVTTQKLAPDAVTIEKLNVLSKNIINPLTAPNAGDTQNTDGVTPEGWSGDIRLINDPVYGYCGRLLNAAARASCTATFSIMPEDIFEIKVTLRPLYTAPTSGGLTISLSPGSVTDIITWDTAGKKWTESTGNNNVIISGYGEPDDRSFTTYIIGKNVDVKDVPAPKSSGDAIPRCIRVIAGTTSLSFAEDSSNGYGRLIIRPQIYRIGDGRIVAENIITKNLSAISGDLGWVNAGLVYQGAAASGFGGKPNTTNLDNFFDLDTGEFRIGNARSFESASDKDTNGGEWLHYIPGAGIFFKVANFIVTAVSSIIKGALRVVRKTGTGAATTLFSFNPETSSQDGVPAAAMNVGTSAVPIAENHYGALTRTGDSTLKGLLDVFNRLRVFRNNQTTSDKPVFESNPGSAAGSESTAVRGAFRVRKSTTDETLVLEATPDGMVRGATHLGKISDGVTAANIFANPPLNTMGAISYHRFDANPFPAGYKSPLQSGSAESWNIITLNLSANRASQIAIQNFSTAYQNRTFIRSRHVDNTDYTQWQKWKEIGSGHGTSFWFSNLQKYVNSVDLGNTKRWCRIATFPASSIWRSLSVHIHTHMLSPNAIAGIETIAQGWSDSVAWLDIPVFVSTATKQWGNWNEIRGFNLQIRRNDESGGAELWLYAPDGGVKIYYSIELLYPYTADVMFSNTAQESGPTYVLPPKENEGNISTYVKNATFYNINVDNKLNIGASSGIVQIGNDTQIMNINQPGSLCLNGVQNPNIYSHFYLMRNGAWQQVVAYGDSPTFGNVYANTPPLPF